MDSLQQTAEGIPCTRGRVRGRVTRDAIHGAPTGILASLARFAKSAIERCSGLAFREAPLRSERLTGRRSRFLAALAFGAQTRRLTAVLTTQTYGVGTVIRKALTNALGCPTHR